MTVSIVRIESNSRFGLRLRLDAGRAFLYPMWLDGLTNESQRRPLRPTPLAAYLRRAAANRLTRHWADKTAVAIPAWQHFAETAIVHCKLIRSIKHEWRNAGVAAANGK